MSSPNVIDIHACQAPKCRAKAQWLVLPLDGGPKRETCEQHLPVFAVEGDKLEPLLSKVDIKPMPAAVADDLADFIGTKLKCMDGNTVTVETIQGSMVYEPRFLINGQHFIVMLDAYKQLHKDASITQSMIDEFDKIKSDRIYKLGNPGGH